MKRTKSGKILIRVGPDAAKRLARNEAIAKKQSERAARKTAKKAATAARRATRKAANAAAAARRKAARKAATKAKRQAERDKYNNTPPDQRPKRKTPWHPRGPNATEKYNSYARRLERSKKLRPSQISPTLYAVSRWLVNTTTSGDPISCNCPDFTQVEGARNWQGSNAGPFNPCKHMMAIKIKWKCANGVCLQDPTGIYNSKAECEAALIPANFTGGQCVGIRYRVEVRGVLYYNDGTGRTLPFASFTWAVSGESPISYAEPYGAITAIDPFRSDLPAPPATLPGEYNNGCNVKGKNSVGTDANFVLFVAGFTPTQYITITDTRITRLDGLPDNCGDPPKKCPS